KAECTSVANFRGGFRPIRPTRELSAPTPAVRPMRPAPGFRRRATRATVSRSALHFFLNQTATCAPLDRGHPARLEEKRAVRPRSQALRFTRNDATATHFAPTRFANREKRNANSHRQRREP